jgi:exopolyphosphatase/guanosine-5'-triphosphate,3'-diphosphate pyrophosphatase
LNALTATLRQAAAIAKATKQGRVAVIDVGSNSVRLVVYEKRSRSLVPIFNEKSLPALGRGLERTGKLNAEGRKDALVNIRRFVALTRAMNVTDVEMLATAAVRDAKDGKEFAKEIERATGVAVRVISGEEEARLSALGVLAGVPGADGLMGDLGGGSLELVLLDKGKIGHQVTLPIGPLRLAEATDGDLDVAQKIVDRQLDELDWLQEVKGRTFYPVGGTWRTLAKMHMEQSHYPLHVIHEYRIGRRSAEDLARVVSRLGRRSLSSVEGISKRRIETLPLGALIMERLLRAAKPERTLFSAYGLREGCLFAKLSPSDQEADPLLVGCADFAGLDSRFESMSDALDSWIAPLFADEDDGRARLREAACLLSDLGWREHPDYRSEQAFMRVLRMPVAGIDHAERVILALIMAVRYGADLNETHYADPFMTLVKDDDVTFAWRIGAVMRLAYSLSGGTLAMFNQTRISKKDNKISLHLPQERLLFGEAVMRRLEAVGRAFDKAVQIV